MIANRFLLIAFVLAGTQFAGPDTSAQTICPTTAIANGNPADATLVASWFSCKAPTDNPSFTGNVGIGTASPGYPLTVVGAGGGIGSYTVNSLFVQDQINYRGIYLGYDPSSQTGLVVGGTSGAASSLGFITYNAGWIERMIINGNGNVGVGTLTPYALFDAAGVVRSTGNSGSPAGGGGIDMYYSVGAPGGVLEAYDYSASTNTKLDLYGSTVTIHNVSDGRLKTNVLPLNSAEGLQAIIRLRPVSFNWKDREQSKDRGRQVGLIAQEVQQVLPRLVSQGKAQTIHLQDGTSVRISDPLTVNYEGLIVPLVKAVQEQQAEITLLKTRMKALTDDYRRLRLEQTGEQGAEGPPAFRQEVASRKSRLKIQTARR